MTKERAVEILNFDLDILGQYGDGTAEAYKMAIKALEQRGCVWEIAYERGKVEVLDKIRAEIKQRKKNSGGDPSRDLAFNVCLQIIDKYKAESEESEDGKI